LGWGCYFEIEVKHPEKTLSIASLRDSQVKRIGDLRKNNISHGVFNDFDRFLAFVKMIKARPRDYHRNYSGIDEGCFK
jgi:hypothetical protein